MSNFLEFTCAGCNHTNLVDPSEIPEGGANRQCQSCGVAMFVTREGATLAAEPPPSGEVYREPGEAGLGVHIRMASGKVEHLSADVIQQGVEAKRVLPWDLVSDDGQEFHPISEHPELSNLFFPDDFRPTIQRQCVNHPGGFPAGTCRRCGRSYCSECVGALLRTQPRLCPACNGAVADPDPRLSERPPWERPREVALFPIDGDAWKLTVAAGLIIWVASWSLITLPLLLIVLALVLHVVELSSRGAKKLPLPQNLDLKHLVGQVVPVLVLSVIVAAPLMLIRMLMPPVIAVFLQLPFWIVLLVYYPMAVGLLMVFDDRQKALEPRTVGRVIWALKEDYLLLLLLLIAVAVIVLAAQTFASFIPWLGVPLGSVAAGYGAVLQAHLLGWLLYMNRERILAAV